MSMKHRAVLRVVEKPPRLYIKNVTSVKTVMSCALFINSLPDLCPYRFAKGVLIIAEINHYRENATLSALITRTSLRFNCREALHLGLSLKSQQKPG